MASSFPEVPDFSFPQNDLDYVTMQIHEDKSDLQAIKKHLSRSVQEFTMAQKLTAMGQLSSYYAHELKNPLHNLLSCVSVLEDPSESEEEKNKILQLIKSELKRVTDLTNKMRSHFKPSEEKPGEANLNELLLATLSVFQRKFQEINIQTLVDLDESIPPLFVVSDQIKQVFINLLMNAAEAMPNGGKIFLASFHIPPIVRITITDTGIGMSPIDLERIFEAFYTTKKEKGTGLGLFVCYNIIQRHGGSIKVTSNPGEGTSFEITLPT